MLQGTIRNDDFKRNTALQCWSNVVTIRNNVATMLQRCVALKNRRAVRSYQTCLMVVCFFQWRYPCDLGSFLSFLAVFTVHILHGIVLVLIITIAVMKKCFTVTCITLILLCFASKFGTRGGGAPI